MAIILLLRDRYRDFENPVLKPCAGLFRVCAFGQRNCAIELPIPAFSSVNIATVLLALAFTLAFNHESIVGHFHLDVLGL
jgi:hypothetical protein